MQPLVPPQAQAQAVPTHQPQAQAVPVPPVLPIGMHNVPFAVGQSGHPPNAQLLYGLLVPQNNEDHLLSVRQPMIVMYNCMIPKCFTCNLKYDPNFMCAPHNMVIRSKLGLLLMAAKFDAKTIQMGTTVSITSHVLEGNCQVQ